MSKKENTFFTKDFYDNNIGLDVNEEVLERVYHAGISSKAELPIEFFFVSDDKRKLEALGLTLIEKFPLYTDLKIQPYDNAFELTGTTQPIQMELRSINEWNKMMWDLGYNFDCKLDGWQVESKGPNS